MKPTSILTYAAFIAAITALAPNGAKASPSAFNSSCGAITVDNQTGSTLMRDTQDCKLIWVLPPTAGFTELTGFSPSGNLGMCKEVKSTQGQSARIMERLEETSKSLDELKPEYDKANKRLADAKNRVHELQSRTEVKQLDDMQLRLETVDSSIAINSKALETCTNNCDQYQAEYRALSKEKLQLNGDIRKLRQANIATIREYDRAKATQNSAEETVADVGKGVDEIMNKQTKFHKDLLDLLLFYSRIEGGTAQIDYNTGWDEAVSDLTAKYGGDYQFRKVNTKEARIFGNIVGASNENTYLSSMPAILDYTINGMKYQPFGEEKIAEQQAMPSHMAGDIRLSLMGGCPLYYKDFLNSDGLEKSDTAPQAYKFAISATYKFPAAYKLKMTASYNLYKFYEKIVNSSSSGGFFSSHHATDIVENQIDRDTFSIDWNVEDPDSKYDENNREQIGKDLKLDLIGRVLGTMAKPVFGAPPELSAITPAAGPHGAVVLANGIMTACGYTNYWCTAGSWLLTGLDSIFGNDSASSSYRATHDSTATETWDTTSVKWNTGATVFSSKK